MFTGDRNVWVQQKTSMYMDNVSRRNCILARDYECLVTVPIIIIIYESYAYFIAWCATQIVSCSSHKDGLIGVMQILFITQPLPHTPQTRCPMSSNPEQPASIYWCWCILIFWPLDTPMLPVKICVMVRCVRYFDLCHPRCGCYFSRGVSFQLVFCR